MLYFWLFKDCHFISDPSEQTEPAAEQLDRPHAQPESQGPPEISDECRNGERRDVRAGDRHLLVYGKVKLRVCLISLFREKLASCPSEFAGF